MPRRCSPTSPPATSRSWTPPARIARSAVLVGRTAADLVMNFLTLSVMLLVGVAVGFRPSEPAYDLALAFVLVLAFSYVFSWISAFIGPSVRDPWVFPLTFASSAFVPTSSMPDVLRAFAQVNPGHGHPLSSALCALAWLAGLLIVFVPLAVRAFRRVVHLPGGLVRQLVEQRRHLLECRLVFRDVVAGGQITRVAIAERGALGVRPYEDAQRQLDSDPRVAPHQRRPGPRVAEHEDLLVGELQARLARGGGVIDPAEHSRRRFA